MPSNPSQWVLLRPATAFPHLLKTAGDTRWIALRRPLIVAAIFGCCISLMTEGSLTLRLAAPAAVYWSFIPLMQVLCLIPLYRRARPDISLPRAIDLSFLSFAPWLLWLLAFSSVWGLVSPARILSWPNGLLFWYIAAAVALIWAAYVDFWFYRVVLGRTARSAAGSLLWPRLLCWSFGLSVFVLSAGWQTVAARLGL